MLKSLLKKTPLPWLLLTKQKVRLTVALSGIAFADILMFMQMGFEGALYDSAVKPYKMLDADLVLTNPQFETLFSVKTTPRDRLYQAAGYEGVESVSPIYISTGNWRNPETLKTRAILVWGIDPERPGLNLPEVQQNLNNLKQLNWVLFDQAGRPEYGNIAPAVEQGGTVEAQLADKSVTVGGVFALGSSFTADGNVITSDSTFLNLFDGENPDEVAAGLIQVAPEADLQEVKAKLNEGLPSDVRVLTLEELSNVEKQYWANGTGIGFIFQMGVTMGFIVGIVIVYQILYSDVSDHLAEFATLKAMGYSNGYLVKMLLQEALILSVLGFIPSFFLALGLYQVTFAATMLPIAMNAQRAINVLALTIIMCSLSGTIAMRKLQAADPADVF
ncbi:FtsX-like permease family protein [Phormidium tenue FACHB-886]|nr:FtsX-like permease family protein [Phormidium tenue FACHB-886]